MAGIALKIFIEFERATIEAISVMAAGNRLLAPSAHVQTCQTRRRAAASKAAEAFGGFSRSARTRLVSRSERIDLPELSANLLAKPTACHLVAGETLFRVGEDGDGCYRLDKGVLKVIITSPSGDERILGIIGPGSIVGELAIIDGRPRSAPVIAARDCDLSFISRAVFNEYTRAASRDLQISGRRACVTFAGS